MEDSEYAPSSFERFECLRSLQIPPIVFAHKEKLAHRLLYKLPRTLEMLTLVGPMSTEYGEDLFELLPEHKHERLPMLTKVVFENRTQLCPLSRPTEKECEATGVELIVRDIDNPEFRPSSYFD